MNLLRLITFRAGAGGLDPDAEAFINAAGITDATQKTAINQLVLDLKTYSLWTKMKAVYPIVGGTATTHKYNLINPADTDAAFRLTFSGTWTHSSTGMASSSGAYANTHLVPNTVLSAVTDQHMSYYSETSNTGLYDMGAGSTNSPNLNLYIKFVSNSNFYGELSGVAYSIGSAVSGLGLGVVSSTSSNIKVYFNTTSNSFAAATGSKATDSIFIGASNSGGSASYATDRTCAFASIGDGLNSTEAGNLYTAVQAYQTTLGRQV